MKAKMSQGYPATVGQSASMKEVFVDKRYTDAIRMEVDRE